MDALEWDDVPMSNLSPGGSWDIGSVLPWLLAAAILAGLLVTIRGEVRRV